MLATLKQIREHIKDRGLGISIHELKKLCTDHHMNKIKGLVEAVENDYELMSRFFAEGFEDAQRPEIYAKLERRLYTIILGMEVECMGDQNPTFKQCQANALSMSCEYENIEETLSRYVQELALASLDPNADEKQKDIHQRLLRYRIFVFNFIYTSKPWTQSESETMTKLLISPFVDVIDQQIILGAMLMAQRTVFDVFKFETLCKVVQKTDNIFVRERALVAIALAMPDETDFDVNGDIIDETFTTLLANNGIRQELTDIQTQFLLCMDTVNNDKTIQTEIIPSLLKNSEQMMKKKESDEEKLDSLLHPDKEEKQIEEVEAMVDKMRNMQKNGADIFFSSFSQAKRFSFFYTMMNWFCPFYIEHPQVAVMNFKDMPIAFMEKIIVGQLFCNSDKYSFILSLAHVINQIPKDMLNLMQKGEMAPEFEDVTSDNPTFIRRSYINDLYRFFNLYSDKNNFRNPFASDENVCFFTNRIFVDNFRDTQYPLRVSRQLLKHHCYKALDTMLSIYSDNENLEWLKLLALSNEHKHRYHDALDFFYKALEMAPDNKAILSRAANVAFQAELFKESFDLYQRYIDLSTENDDTDVEEFRMALCELKQSEIDYAMKRLFRLSYNDPENAMYRKALAFGYLLSKRFPEALRTYENIKDEDYAPNDIIRKCIALWMNHKNDDAIKTLKSLIEQNAGRNDINIIEMMINQLYELRIEDMYFTEAFILIDLAIKDKLN